MKKYIPNLLTISRIVVTPLIIYLGLSKHYLALLIIAVFIALTDFLDGKLARMWHTTSELGAKLDTIADKVLAFSLLIVLITQNEYFIIVFILETLIASFNVYYYYKLRIVESLLIGKIKTWIIFFTILLGFLRIIFPQINISLNVFLIITIILQILCLIKYAISYNQHKKLKKKLKNLESEYYRIVKDILNSKEFQKRKNFMHHYNESVYDHVLRVSLDCYKIGKKFKLDYKSLAIAGLLHDFYSNPWQVKKKKTKFFQKHGFVHAHEARVNAEKYFPELMNPKICSMIETHMFPLNKRIPRSKEAWLLTLVDKADSLEFLMHPLLFTGLVKLKKVD